ncbi:MAG TPA: glucose-6-phosphate isomerase [Archaeoglobaceae archaeon]|nr:glucose-6-phosphate isomerase [Archaeoglobaceae archaeon]
MVEDEDVLKVCRREFKPAIRWAKDLLPVLAYPDALKENFKAYFMYRDVFHSKSDREEIKNLNLRYDITVIPPNMIGNEFIKTYGHYHPIAEENLSYTEIYEVLEGEAIYLLQKNEGGSINDIIAVEASKGDKVIIPPNYGHVTINASNKVLKMANWVYRGFSSDYKPYEELKGACYYYTLEGWIENGNYRKIPEMKFVKPRIPKLLGLKKSEEMYKLIKNPKKLEFLFRPSIYTEMFEEAFEEK